MWQQYYAEWTYEGRKNEKHVVFLVIPDGNSTRYKGSVYELYTKVREHNCANLGGTAEVISFCPSEN